MADTVTRAVIKQDVLRVLAKRDSVLANLPMPLITTSTGSASTIVDTKLGRGTGQSNRFDGRAVEIISGANDGNKSGIDDGGFNGTDTLTISPVVTSTENAVNYLIYPLGLGPEVLEELLSEILRDTRGPHYWFPSLVSDPDLTNLATYADDTDWNTVESPASSTPAFVSDPANVFLGEFSVHVFADAADEGFESLSINVSETEKILVSVYVKVAVGSMDVVLYDVTGATAITTVVVDEPAWTEVRFSADVPDASELISIHFLSDANLDEFYVSAPIVLQATSDRWYDAPSWLSYSGQILAARYLPAGTAAITTDTFVPLTGRPQGGEMPGTFEMSRAVHQVKLAGLKAADDRPVYLDVIRHFDDVTTNAGTTVADRQYLRDAIIAAVLRNWPDPEHRVWARRASDRAQALGYNPREVRIESNPKVSV